MKRILILILILLIPLESFAQLPGLPFGTAKVLKSIRCLVPPGFVIWVLTGPVWPHPPGPFFVPYPGANRYLYFLPPKKGIKMLGKWNPIPGVCCAKFSKGVCVWLIPFIGTVIEYGSALPRLF